MTSYINRREAVAEATIPALLVHTTDEEPIFEAELRLAHDRLPYGGRHHTPPYVVLWNSAEGARVIELQERVSTQTGEQTIHEWRAVTGPVDNDGTYRVKPRGTPASVTAFLEPRNTPPAPGEKGQEGWLLDNGMREAFRQEGHNAFPEGEEPLVHQQHIERRQELGETPLHDFDEEDIWEFIRLWPGRRDGKGLTVILCDWQNYMGVPRRDDGIPSRNPDHLEVQRRTLNYVANHPQPVTVIMLTPSRVNVPDELNEWVHAYDFPVRNEDEWTKMVSSLAADVNTYQRNADGTPRYPELENMSEEEARSVARSLRGLPANKGENQLLLSLTETGNFSVPYLNKAQADELWTKGRLRVINPTITMGDVGGCDVWKEYCSEEVALCAPHAITAGLGPRNVLLVGSAGTGKSMGSTLIPLLTNRLCVSIDGSDLKGSYVGESEAKTTRLWDLAEQIGDCYLRLDDGEKTINSGANSARDGGASAGVLGIMLTRMQENQSGVRVIFTCNDVSVLPPEFEDRFDYKFYFDLPSTEERVQIFAAHMNKFSLSVENYDLQALAASTDGYNGRGIARLVKQAVTTAFMRNHEQPFPTMEDFAAAKLRIGSAPDPQRAEALREMAKNRGYVMANIGNDATASATAQSAPVEDSFGRFA